MKVYLDTVGCRLNQSEIETMARQFRAAGHQIVAVADDAEMAVVNTCAVTSQAAADSRGTIRRIARAGVDEIIATGCWATLQPEKAAALPRVQRVVDNEQKEALVPDILNLPVETFDLEPIAREPLPGLRQRTRAFIKVQDGCDNRCTFCITTVARGDGRSRPLADVIADVQSALDGGTKEVVLTGVHLGSWGQDLSTSASASSARRLKAGQDAHLRDLVKAILTHTDTPRLRLSSLEPWDLIVGRRATVPAPTPAITVRMRGDIETHGPQNHARFLPGPGSCCPSNHAGCGHYHRCYRRVPWRNGRGVR